MRECEIVIETSIKPFRVEDGIVGIAFCTKGAEPKTLFGKVKDCSENKAALLGLKNALGYCSHFEIINLQTTNGYLASGLKSLPSWKVNGFITKKGAQIKHQEIWQEIEEIIKGKEMRIHLNEFNDVRKWLSAECRRRATR